jgi:hypothetical protein
MPELKLFVTPDDAKESQALSAAAKQAISECATRGLTVAEYPAWGEEAERVGALRPPAVALDADVVWAGSIPDAHRLASILRARLRRG